MRTSKDDVYVAGDVAGIEEASSAMEEGRIAGISAAEALGYIDSAKAKESSKHSTSGDWINSGKVLLAWPEEPQKQN